ncbi:hypothetical protein G9U51_01700 [Calidifontibacter sp. DB0510]|uniref:ABC transporter permease n=1 Tax=Metallococcus carri TaxID=1656884 RepID=A0A967AWX7_9MICO|nr:hypothetical protein [Metallococcus carri]NHN54494.1 hypothetical protein [Metallococcus carri]NOP36667.1 hypothetical protein [Calidifontibacter sp. DB2511S]
MITAYRAELARIITARTLAVVAAITVLYATLVPWALVANASPRPGRGLSLIELSAAGGGTTTIARAASFSSVLLLAIFTAVSANDFQRGTFRAALLHHPRRLSLIGGQFLARLTLLAGWVLALYAVGWVATRLIAPHYGVDTSAWLTGQSWRDAGSDVARTFGFAAGWALLGTTLGVLTRSVAIGLAVGVAWAGPIENVIGDQLSFGERWFPGLLLRWLSAPDMAPVGQTATLTTLAAYAAVCAGILALAVSRRDVTS